MKNVIFLLMLLFSSITGKAQGELDLVKIVADKICEGHNHDLVIKEDSTCKISSYYQEWRYVNGVLGQAMIDLFAITGEQKYLKFVKDNFDLFFNKKNESIMRTQYDKGVRDYGYSRFFSMSSLDDCGAMGASLAKLSNIYKESKYRKYLNNIEQYILYKQSRLDDGTFCRGKEGQQVVWLDDMYMSISFLSQYGHLYGSKECLDLAAKEAVGFDSLLKDDNTGIYYHCYYVNDQKHGVAHWGRANGWCLYALALLLDVLPENHALYSKLMEVYRNAAASICRYQDAQGMWHQLLDKNDSYQETSCTAMFAYSIAKGINRKWLDQSYTSVARAAWEGLKLHITSDGELKDICMGTGISRDLPFYYSRPTPLNDAHGLGAVIQCGIEVYKIGK